MFDRQKQPRWLQLVNFMAVLVIAALVFTYQMRPPLWLTILLGLCFSAVAALNFVIHFRDILQGNAERKVGKNVVLTGIEKDESHLLEQGADKADHQQETVDTAAPDLVNHHRSG